ncbi:hypothetical protein ACFLYM_00050 [Chloroflexota bacterium]
MKMKNEYRQRLAKEYRYAVTKMQETQPLPNKLFYFSVFFGDAQRVLNWEWDRDLALIHLVTQHVHTQFNGALQQPPQAQVAPVDWVTATDRLTQAASDLATYFEKAESENNKEVLYQILGWLAEIAYAVSGNGSYLFERGSIKL